MIGQSIAATTTVEEGSTIIFTVSRGLRVINVGSYIGSTIESASAAAQNAGLAVGTSTYVFSDEEEGTVIDQSLDADLNVAEGTTITFTVSKGKETYTVTYADDGGATILWSGEVEYNKSTPTPDLSEFLVKDGYVFAGWSPEVSPTVTATVTYIAQWTPVEEEGN